MAILEMVDRPGSPLYHVEHFIEGKYVKYNSNSGFVRSEALRMTPQAFSHFTFERYKLDFKPFHTRNNIVNDRIVYFTLLIH